ncbi:MAG: hypothetical protein GY952_05650 [Rhodobacteraceae bacterium]|nr:hypothetical protein [Paracoccaceae bacterium]
MRRAIQWCALAAVLLGAAPGVWALEETAVFETIIARIEGDTPCEGGAEPFWQRLIAQNPQDGYRVRYSRFGCKLGRKGVIIVAPGRTEASVEYYETAIDFIAMGYGPIYVVDHRGQGMSPRLLPDLSKGHIERFDDYVADFRAVVEAVQSDLSEFGGTSSPPLFFVSNSMGGAIGLGYFQVVGERNPFTAAVLAGPMIRVNYISFVDPQTAG